MPLPIWHIAIALVAGIGFIVMGTVRFSWHPFFALLVACFITGLIVGIPFMEIVNLIKTGIGDILSKLVLIIVLGTAIGVVLEKNGSTQVMAAAILKLVGEKRSALAINITGFVVGLPIFCDSGFIVLNGLNKSLTRRTHYTITQMSISLAAGLYAVHCMVPPHPGATAAAGNLGVDVGRLLLFGIIVAVPAALVGYAWSLYAGRKQSSSTDIEIDNTDTTGSDQQRPAVWLSFLPVVIPIVLMSLRSLVVLENKDGSTWIEILKIAGDPAVALAIGLVIALSSSRKTSGLQHILGNAVEKAAGILIIIAAGAAFGAVLGATKIGESFSKAFDLGSIGILFPFLLTAVLKTAQGSSTVSIVTASSIILPLLPALGLDSENGKLLAVMAMGAGSMLLSHTNDAYFWVISKFAGVDIRSMLRVHTIASALMGLVSILIVYLLSLFLL